jgi:hypothetical protein
MDREIGIILVLIAAIGMLSTLFMLRRQRIASMGPIESPFATSTEGEKRCLKCGLGNLVTSATCAGCDAKLPG